MTEAGPSDGDTVSLAELREETQARLASAGLDNAQVEAVWSDIAAKRKVARYLHMAPVLVE